MTDIGLCSKTVVRERVLTNAKVVQDDDRLVDEWWLVELGASNQRAG